MKMGAHLIAHSRTRHQHEAHTPYVTCPLNIPQQSQFIAVSPDVIDVTAGATCRRLLCSCSRHACVHMNSVIRSLSDAIRPLWECR